MQPLTVADVRPPSAYEPVRALARSKVVELRRQRRVALGELLTVVFENRDTIRGALEELLRAERIEDAERIARELEAFNPLLPARDEVCATLFIEVADPAELAGRVDQLQGIATAVHIDFGGRRARSRLDADPSGGEGTTGSVHHLRFHLDEAQRAALLGEAEVALVADHDHYTARTVLDAAQRAALRADLLASS